MIEQINNELLKLQEELSKFDGAISKISKAGELSNSLIDSSKDLQKSFGEHIKKIEILFSGYMNKTYANTESKLSNIFDQFQERVEHEEKAVQKFSELIQKTEHTTETFLKKTTTDTKNKISEFINEVTTTLAEEKKYIKIHYDNLSNEIKKLIIEHNKKLKTEQEVLDNYLELAKETANLSAELKAVNFPGKLSEINNNIDNIKTKISSNGQIISKISNTNSTILTNTQNILADQTPKKILTTTQKIYADTTTKINLEKTKKINTKVNTIRFFSILTFIFIVLFLAFFSFAFIELFPNLFENLFK